MGRPLALDLLQVLKEELQLLGGSLSVALIDQISLGLFYATVIDGRNTAASDVFSVSLAYSFTPTPSDRAACHPPQAMSLVV